MAFYIFQILLFLGFGIGILACFERKTIRRIIAAFISIFLLLQMTSVYIGGSLVDYKFWEHLNFDNLALTFDLFKMQLLLALFIGLGTYWGALYLSRKIQSYHRFDWKYSLALALGLGALMFLPDGIGRNLYELQKLENSESVSLNRLTEGPYFWMK